MEILQFILSSFWTWLGAILLIAAVFDGIADVVKAIRPHRTVRVSQSETLVTVEIQDAAQSDVDLALASAAQNRKESDTCD